jgi:hypothetical protein
MSEPTSSETDRTGASLERSREEILAAARALPPYEDMVIDDLTEEESRRFMEIILDL